MGSPPEKRQDAAQRMRRGARPVRTRARLPRTATIPDTGTTIPPGRPGALISTVLAAVVGIGMSAVLTNQTLAITVVVVWTATLEPLLVGFVPEVGRWFPGGAASSLAGTVTAEGGLLPFWSAAFLLAGYGLTLAEAGTRRVVRRDIS